jgi:GcrA cell cycle regulator
MLEEQDVDWSPARIETVKGLWADGLSASLIGEKIGKTRNAVLAKVTRLRIMGQLPVRQVPVIRANRSPSPRRVKPKDPHPTPTPIPTPSGGGVKLSPTPSTQECDSPIVDVIVPMGERRGVEDLKPSQCKWPMGDPQSQGFHFCHHKRQEDRPYCVHHARIAFVPSTYSGAGGK